MISYLESSVLLRVVLGQPNVLEGFRALKSGFASALTEVESLRALDRLRWRGLVGDDALAHKREDVYRLTAEMDLVEVNRPILDRASQPFPVSLGTLDAIHLATALAWRDASDAGVTFAIHDRTLAAGARACGLHVIGC